LIEHDLFGKPVSTFPDHAPVGVSALDREGGGDGTETDTGRQRRTVEEFSQFLKDDRALMNGTTISSGAGLGTIPTTLTIQGTNAD
jgi:hypothetical protein